MATKVRARRGVAPGGTVALGAAPLSAARARLPYRETSDCFITYRGKLVARADINRLTRVPHIRVPGGGIEAGESPLRGARRKCLAEVGAKLRRLKLVITICWDWFPEWANTELRKERYAQFRGEMIHICIGTVDKFVKPTAAAAADAADAADAAEWTGKRLMSVAAAVKLVESGFAVDHPNTDPYRIAQLTVLKMLQLRK